MLEELADRVSFGYLTVPENREDSASRNIEVAFTRVRNTSGLPSPDPVIILPGGPGQGGSGLAKPVLSMERYRVLLKERDFVFIDPRGCGYSVPKLCPNLNDPRVYYESVFLSGQEWREERLAATDACADSLAGRGVPVRKYNSVEVAHDIEALRRALGYAQWNLRGQSYGSYYGFVLMQEHAETVRSAFLSAIVSLDAHTDHFQASFLRSLDGVMAACADDADCQAAYPDLTGRLTALLAKLDANPLPVRLPAPEGGPALHFTVTPAVFVKALLKLLYSRHGMEIVPALIEGLLGGHDFIIQNLADRLLQSDGLYQDMLLIIQGNDDAAKPAAFNRGIAEHGEQFRPEWLSFDAVGRQLYGNLLDGSAAPAVRLPDTVAVPTVLISGEFDPVTPAEQGEAMLEYLSVGTHLVVRNSGHYAHTDGDFDYASFLAHPTADANHIGVTSPPPLDFVRDVRYSRVVSSLLAGLSQQQYGPLVLPLLALLCSLIALILLSVQWLRASRSPRPVPNIAQRIVLWSLPVVTLVAIGLLTAAIYHALSSNPLILAMGLPAGWDVLYVLYGLQLASLLALIVVMPQVWRSRKRVPGVIALVGALAFGGFIFWG